MFLFSQCEAVGAVVTILLAKNYSSVNGAAHAPRWTCTWLGVGGLGGAEKWGEMGASPVIFSVAQTPGEVVVLAGSRKVNTWNDPFSSPFCFPVQKPLSGRQLHHLEFKNLIKGVNIL